MRAVRVVGHAQRDALAGLYQRCGFADLFGGDEVDRAQLVIRTPSAPVGAGDSGEVVIQGGVLLPANGYILVNPGW